tara:strand:+ start:143 stop:553 length:411 start_codon:yes stop_codon:yes gene_type:complete
MNELQYVPHNYVLKVWGKVEPLVTKALKHNDGEMFSNDVLKSLLEKEYILWVGVQGKEILMAVVAEMVEYPRKKALNIITWGTKSGYDYELWMKEFYKIEHFAKVNGCSFIEAGTRKGLAKKLNWEYCCSVVRKHI